MMPPAGACRRYACLAVLVLVLPVIASAQVRVQVASNPDSVPKDHSANLPWRDLQSRKVLVDNVTPRCLQTGQSDDTPAVTANAASAGPRFLRGKPSPDCMFSDLVRIDFVNIYNEPTRCTGVMIDDNMLLTAGHCACGKIGSYRLYQQRDRQLEHENAGLTRWSVLAKPPVLFDGFTCDVPPELQAGRDLAVLIIESARNRERRSRGTLTVAASDQHFLGLNVATSGQIFADREETSVLIGAGYGETDDGSLPDHLQFAAIPIASLFCAYGRFADSNCAAYREFVLADTLERRNDRPSDSCGGDSGAPIFYMPRNPPNAPGQPQANGSQSIMLVGITSRGLRGVNHQTRSRCGGGGIYTAVGHPDVVSWLRSFGIDIFSLFPLINPGTL